MNTTSLAKCAGAFDAFDNLFANIDALFNYHKTNSLSSHGLRFIGRPHDLIAMKNDNGEITGYKIQTVYTPFTKDEVSITVKDNALNVVCGKENKVKEENDEYIYNGVSHQTYSFSIPIDETVDVKAITAKAEDGMLNIELPLKKLEEKEDEAISIEVQ